MISKRDEEILAGLRPEQREFVELLLPKLPPIIARHDVERVLGGIVAANSLKNADCSATGPELAWEIGRKKAYYTASLLVFVVQKYGIKRLANVNSL